MPEEIIYPNVKKMTEQMYYAQNGNCGYCGTPKMMLKRNVSKRVWQCNKPLRASFDHVVPRIRGGKYELSNGVCVCNKCNQLKGTLPLEDFFEQYDELLAYDKARPQRVYMKRLVGQQKSAFMLARYAVQTGRSIAAMALIDSALTTYDLIKIGVTDVQ